jgi:hypothetical protein
MAKELRFGKDARGLLEVGVNALADAVVASGLHQNTQHEPDWPDAKQSVAELNEGKQGRRAAGSTPSGSASC